MDTDKKFDSPDQTFNIIGCAMDALNVLGPGFLEKVYENSIIVELKARGIPFKQQERFKVTYKETSVGEFIPDLIAYDNIVIDIKTIDKITNIQIGQMLNYPKVTGLPIGLILNFKNQKLEWQRVAL